MSFDGHTLTVRGTAGAVLGAAPLTVEVRDTTANTKVSGVTVAADGSFTATLAATAGDAVSVVATDSVPRSSAPVSLGAVPFGSAVTAIQITPATAANDANFRARRLALDGNNLAVSQYPTGLPEPNKIVV